MKVIQTALGKNHYFHLARYLHQQNALECIYSGYPWFKLTKELLPQTKVKTFPWLLTPFMAGTHFSLLGKFRDLNWIYPHWIYWHQTLLDKYVSYNFRKCDVFIGQSQNSLLTGKKAKAQGALYICDRPCSHISHQSEILKDELSLWNVKPLPGNSVDQRSVFIEEKEYDLADYVVVPSEFARRSFLEKGYPKNKVVKISLGADLTRFRKVSGPDPGTFTVLFVGQVNLRKGFLHLLEAFNALKIKKKRLIVIGELCKEVEETIKIKKIDISQVEFINHVDNSDLYKFYNKSNVFVLPSIEDGFGVVMSEAMACGCPVIATENTGASDLFENGKEGFIVPIRNANILVEKMQQLYEDKALRARMSEAAQERIKSLGGWDTYGKNYYEFLKANLKNK
jgi:glycosyltransferase involved in cell wall biosynthesis